MKSHMIFIETTIFTKLLPKYLTDDEYRALQWYLIFYPEAGDIVPGSGGVRKVRWTTEGKGKRGGIRIMYYWKKSAKEIWLLTLYSKSEKATIPGHILKMIAEEIKNE
jgi:mRNA-degrading endonuclease RelE of RelBE toxin-antitoxin system